ncbi:TetR/AcrR family transcriptional regulator [Photobacterium lipolyticum]|uniref:TetR family transcriptional regulator n=1 Tax=Photobacterium lipolyticum TaxID=266810 RepID=A0A2T3N152_9GAMM|nr:TetR/AcrR family transcriptional regulator [Photobacterium lipolyticum]PSW06026.1 TetR family transcriptional regulator [Photobacterium lipolyticum]
MKKESTQERLERIHKAVTTLVSNRDINNISIYDVAKEAAIATSTVYHHYPNMEALVYRLMEDIFEDFKSVLTSAIKPKDIHHWSDINRMVEQGFVDYYSSNPLVQRILLGQHTYSSIRHADAENDVILAEQVESIYRKYFKLPQLPEDVNIFAIALQVADKVYSMNYRENGIIPKEMAREAVILTEAYLGVYLPKHLPKSEEVVAEDISLH